MVNILFGLIAIILLLGLAVLFSNNRKAIKYKIIIPGILVQVFLAIFVLKVSIGQKILMAIANGLNSIFNNGFEGIKFVFGDLSLGFVFAINVLGLIVFTSALVSLLYYLKILPIIVNIIGKAVSKIMGTTLGESFNAVGNIFLGGTEAPILIKPYLKSMTKSELFAVMAAGFGSASAAILGGYSMMGIDSKYLLIAIFSVPFSTLMVSKILYPEAEDIEIKDVKIENSTAKNVFDAIGEGTGQGLQLALNVGASLIAFIGLMALINSVLGVVGLSITSILGFLLRPLSILFHIPSSEAASFASLIGTKMAVNEFVAFSDMSAIINTLSPRTIAVLSVALCNFANLSSIGIQIGGFSILAPERREEVTRNGLRALLSGTISTLITASIIGMIV
ncbi:NupC/NupG family nucleoside CNT transporter [Clostridium senegalense]|uniref:NupC/NupG family nucleoside CNT transporter n=1 Tax=Clostridium senegalense TaxID=1465809 RepID=UPI00028847F0|nr:nucleoside transporter C-terminal domain-containing protein [Clostridium senegalense]